ncbi:hypothetical protein AAF712_006635 [Marasmius tenuissimus]|uniref:Uncharacterized protein n=1 Tax=Marasmius tenuissimus TaxID=585030 RepID=A0ABR2ZZ85_9AGAR
MPIVNKGDVLLVPSSADDTKQRLHIEWQQSLSKRSGDYYTLVARNKSQGNVEVPFFCQTEWFNAEHLGQKNAEGYYEVTMSDKYQYGQKNKNGDNRWVAFHDKGRKMYQHRFVESLFVKGGEVVGKVAGMLGYPIGSVAIDQLKNYFGDYLHDF